MSAAAQASAADMEAVAALEEGPLAAPALELAPAPESPSPPFQQEEH